MAWRHHQEPVRELPCACAGCDKRKRWHVVKLVQRLLTNYFVAPRGLAPPVVGEPRVDWDDREREEDAEEISPIAVSSGKPEGRPLTHFFRPALSELHH